MDWTNETVLEFLEYYENEPIIWNASLSSHKNRNEIYDAWRRLEVKMGQKYSVTEMKKKKDSLMASFRKSLHKVKQSMKSGAGTDEVHKPSWFAYTKMASFLRDKDLPRYTINTENIMPEEFEKNDEEENAADVNTETEGPQRNTIENEALILPSTSKQPVFKAPATKKKKRMIHGKLKRRWTMHILCYKLQLRSLQRKEGCA